MIFKSMGLVIGLLVYINAMNPLQAESKKYAIEGKIHYSSIGNIYIYLVNEKIFEKPLTGLQTIILEANPVGKASGSVSYRFKDVKAGSYGIRCFQDTNGNSKLDRGLFGPSEPWGMSWNEERPSRWPSYEKIEFQVDADLQPVNIELK